MSMSEGIEYEPLQNEVTEALEEVLSKYENSQILKWVALVEVITLEDGERGLWSLANKGAKSWDIKGMLQHAIDMEQARTNAEYLEDDDD